MAESDHSRMNIVVIGHVDSGKSTTTGHLLVKLGEFDERTLEKLKNAAEEKGKGTFYFAHIMDTTKDEQERGITINCTLRPFKTALRGYTIIDAPGHKDFIKNMIVGACQADAAILMVTAGKNEFEAGFSADGTTKEHALLAFTMGVKQIIVAVNKMDDANVNYSQDRYNEIKDEVGNYLDSIGFKKEEINFVPISGWKGDNIQVKSENLPWYTGPTLCEALDGLKAPKRPIKKPLRLPIQSILTVKGVGTIVTGRVETGVLKPLMKLKSAPGGVEAEVKTVEMHHANVEQAFPGDNVGVSLKGVTKADVKRGEVFGETSNNPPKGVTEFTAQIVIMKHPKGVKPGYTPILDLHTLHMACKFETFISKIDRKTGEVVEENPTILKNGDVGMVRIKANKPICVETFKDFQPLGRFAIRDTRTVGVGRVIEIHESVVEDTKGKKK
jgi:elongation factor 1-alpha